MTFFRWLNRLTCWPWHGGICIRGAWVCSVCGRIALFHREPTP